MKARVSKSSSSHFTTTIIGGFVIIVAGFLLSLTVRAAPKDGAVEVTNTPASLAASANQPADAITVARTTGTGAATATAATVTATTATVTATPNHFQSSVKGNILLTKSQQEFAAELAIKTHLDESVIGAWLLNEQSGASARSREAAGNNNWLDIGYTDSAERGTRNHYWFNGPIVAADTTASWMKGELSIEGFGHAADGIIAILQAVGKSPADQIRALQRSPWASAHYPQLFSIYQNVLAHNLRQ